jgi:hypothetical protein
MKILKHPKLTNNWKCPICKTNKDKPVTIINITGTKDDIRHEQFHVDCIDLTWNKVTNILVQLLDWSFEK